MSLKSLTELARSIAIAEDSLIQVEEKARNMASQSKTADLSYKMKYVIKNKNAIFESRFVELGKLLDILYPLRRSLRAQYDVRTAFEALIQLDKGATVLGEKMRFPPCGIYVDLVRGTCASHFSSLLDEYGGGASLRFVGTRVKSAGGMCSESAASREDQIQTARTRILKKLNPLIESLEDYDTHLEKRDTKVGIYNATVFEEVLSACWVPIIPETEGHYEMKNFVALSKRSFVDSNALLPVLYSWRLTLRRQRWSESSSHRDLLKQLCDRPLHLLKNPNVRFPADGVYIDLDNGAFSDKLIQLLITPDCDTTHLTEVIAIVEYCDSHLDDPTSGIYDRAHFEKHFSAKWIID